MLNHELYKIFKAIGGEQARFKKYALLSFLALMFGAALPISNPLIKLNKDTQNTYNTTVNAISQIIVGTSASILAASLIEVFSAMRSIWIKEEKKKSFMFFFGSDIEQGRVAILMPKYDNQAVQYLINLVPSEKKLPIESLQKFVGNADRNLLSFSDTQASVNIEILFEQNGFNRPELRFDDENLDIAQYKTLFIIGLHSNSFLSDRIGQNTLFALEKTLDRQNNQHISKFKIADRLHGITRPLTQVTQEYIDNNSYEYGLIAKLKSNSTIIFVIGGNSANMTAVCSLYLLENWQTIYDSEDNSFTPHIKFKDQIFAICMRLDRTNGNLTKDRSFAQNS